MTPIDPTNEVGLKDAYNTGVEAAHQQGIPSTQHWQGIEAVARAVCPEHHAVYDTRTHVAVPVGDLKLVLLGATDFADFDAEDAAVRCVHLVPELSVGFPKEATNGK